MAGIKVALKKDGTITLSGLPYRRFKSLITQANLYERDELKRVKERHKEAKKAGYEPQIQNTARNVECIKESIFICKLLDDLAKEAVYKNHGKESTLLKQLDGITFWQELKLPTKT